MNGNSESEPDKDSEEFQSANPVISGGKGQTLPRLPAKASANNQTSDNVDVVRNRHKHKSGWRYTFSSLSNPGFLFLWLSMVTMMAGMQMLARGYLVYDMTGSASLLGIVNAGHALPMLGLALFGGAIADRFERKLLIQAGQVVPAVLAFVVGIAIF